MGLGRRDSSHEVPPGHTDSLAGTYHLLLGYGHAMQSSVTLRPATFEDADAIAETHIQTWRETYTGLMPEQFFDASALESRRSMWRSILELSPVPGTVVVAQRDGAVVGFAFAGSSQHPDAVKDVEPARDIHLFSIYLLAAEHGKGVGSALLSAALGDQPAQLWVASANGRAREFYERHGFRADGHVVEDPDVEGLREIRMVR